MLIGIVGKPSVGKSTFFKACTLADVEIANYPFTTIKPNHAIGYVKIDCVDKEFNKQCNPREGFCKNGKRFIPAELLDVAGLVPGAHEGLGMGNQFLDDLRQADVLIHVIDISGSVNEKGESVEPGSYEPANDIKFLEEELDYWYLGIIERGWERFARRVMQEKQDVIRALAKQLSGLNVDEDMVKEGISICNFSIDNMESWSRNDLLQLATYLRKRTKPMLIAANKIDMPNAENNFNRLKERFSDYLFIPCSAESELALREASRKGLIEYTPGENSFEIIGNLNKNQKNALEFIKTNILDKYNTTGVQDVLNTAVFDLLRYIAVFPGGINKLEDKDGNCLPDCFLIREGFTALDFAFKLHTDFGKNFICAKDVMTKMTIGREHKLKHRDVIEIVAGR